MELSGSTGQSEKDMPALNMEEKPSLQEDNSQNQGRVSQLKDSIQQVLDCSP